MRIPPASKVGPFRKFLFVGFHQSLWVVIPEPFLLHSIKRVHPPDATWISNGHRLMTVCLFKLLLVTPPSPLSLWWLLSFLSHLFLDYCFALPFIEMRNTQHSFINPLTQYLIRGHLFLWSCAKQMLLSQWKECIISRWWWGYPSTHSNAQGCFSPSLRSQKDQKRHTLCLSVKYWVSEHTCNHFSLRMKVVCYSFLMNLDIWALLNSWPFLVPHLKTTCSLSKPQEWRHALPSFIHASNKYGFDSAKMYWMPTML